MITHYGADRKPFIQPDCPVWYTRQQRAAFNRGFSYYVSYHRDDRLGALTVWQIQPYQKRGMKHAFVEGWEAARKLDT